MSNSSTLPPVGATAYGKSGLPLLVLESHPDRLLLQKPDGSKIPASPSAILKWEPSKESSKFPSTQVLFQLASERQEAEDPKKEPLPIKDSEPDAGKKTASGLATDLRHLRQDATKTEPEFSDLNTFATGLETSSLQGFWDSRLILPDAGLSQAKTPMSETEALQRAASEVPNPHFGRTDANQNQSSLPREEYIPTDEDWDPGDDLELGLPPERYSAPIKKRAPSDTDEIRVTYMDPQVGCLCRCIDPALAGTGGMDAVWLIRIDGDRALIKNDLWISDELRHGLWVPLDRVWPICHGSMDDRKSKNTGLVFKRGRS